MSKKLTTELFIERATEIHNNFYNYTETTYTLAEDKLKIICPTHGEFYQKASTHLSGHRCPSCARESCAVKMTKSLDNFIEKANKIHDFKYTPQISFNGQTECFTLNIFK